MSARVRLLASACVVSLAFVLAVGASPARALQAAGTASDLVCGVVVSLEPRVVPKMGVIVTDVQVVESQPGGGTVLTRFTMEGGEVGEIGMWSEQFADLRVGDSVIARVTEKDGQTTAVTAPVVGGGLSGLAFPGLDSHAEAVAAGYVWDGLHWADGNLPVPYYVNPSSLPAGATSAITAAAQTWENDSGSYMDYTYAGPTGTSPGVCDGLNVVGSGTPSPSGALAVCICWYYTSTQHIIEFDITYNTGVYSFATNGSGSAYDIQGIGTHELGHTLHLLDMYDAENSNQVMYGYGRMGDTSKRTLAWGDVAGIRAIYAVPVANAAPVAVADVATVEQDTTLTVDAPGVLVNDTDAEGDALTADVVVGTLHGTLTLAAAGGYVYRSAPGFVGTDVFTYRAGDGTTFSAPATVTIAVTAPAQPTSITIRTSATTARTGSVPILSGAVTPNTMIGKNVVVYVKKPGKAYWAYSSNRTAYSPGGNAAWQYKYYFKPGMVKGVYIYKAVVPAYSGYSTSTSPTTVSIRLR